MTTECCGTTSPEAAAPAQLLPLARPTTGCCSTTPEPAPQNTSCCATAEPVQETSCCATGADEEGEPAAVTTGLSLEEATKVVGPGLPLATEPSPYLLPGWLKATEASLDNARAWHSVADRGEQETALLPGFVFDADPIVDADPRTYLGWQPASGTVACCSATTSCCDGAVDEVEALGADAFFPSLLLGSPLGYRSETAASVADPLLVADLIDRIVPSALESGIRSVVVPWLHEGEHSEVLSLALQAYGGHVAFHGESHYLDLQHADYDAYLAALPSRKRRRISQDRARAAASGARVERLDREEIRPLAGRIAELINQNRQKYGGGEDEAHIGALLGALLDDGADVRAYLAFKDDRLAAAVVAVRQGRRLFVKWAGFDYEILGERSGLYFELVFDRPVRDSFEEGLAVIEAGPGADEAKRLRGFRPRQVRSAILLADEALRPAAARLHAAYGEAQRQALGAGEEEVAGVVGRLRARLRGDSAYEPVLPVQPEGGCCG
ncbi:GNAT family N-acetyltransferase [Kitasatospora sp. NBC_01539]|uniref:GNAT family N-acetyltransferase n=1 Tax=Kitasatospora sp. NBC_01539 TaxID=2903577 RepID=UPI0038601F70